MTSGDMFSGHLSWLFTSSQQTPTAFVLVSSQLHLSLFVEKSGQSVIPQSFQPLIPNQDRTKIHSRLGVTARLRYNCEVLPVPVGLPSSSMLLPTRQSPHFCAAVRYVAPHGKECPDKAGGVRWLACSGL